MRSIRVRLLVSFGVLVAILAVSVGLAIGVVGGLSGRQQEVATRTAPYVIHLAKAEVAAKAAAADERGFLLTGDGIFVTEFGQRTTIFEQEMAAARAAALAEASRGQVDVIAAEFAGWAAAVQQEFTLFGTDEKAAVKVALGPNRALRKEYEKRFDAAVLTAEGELTTSVQAADRAAGKAQIWLTLLLLLGLGAGIGTALRVSRGMTRRLDRIGDVLRRLAQGDLTRTVELPGHDEIGQIAASVDLAVGSVRETVQALTSTAGRVTSSSAELVAGNTRIAASAEEASAQANVVAAAADQVSRNVHAVDHLDRGADEPVGAERDDRGGPGR